MGQAPLASPSPEATLMQTRLQKHAFDIRRVVTLSYQDFLSMVKQVNDITQSFTDAHGKQLQFHVKKGTDSTILWKGTVRILCLKVNSRTGIIESTRILNLKQFVRLFGEIMQQANLATMSSSPGTNQFCASMILNEFDQHLSLPSDETSECCICMDRKAEIILACSHMYCEQCIDEWNFSHKTCPICRATVQGRDDTWVLTEKPDATEMVYETRGYLIGLAERTGTPSGTPTDEHSMSIPPEDST